MQHCVSINFPSHTLTSSFTFVFSLDEPSVIFSMCHIFILFFLSDVLTFLLQLHNSQKLGLKEIGYPNKDHSEMQRFGDEEKSYLEICRSSTCKICQMNKKKFFFMIFLLMKISKCYFFVLIEFSYQHLSL